MDSEVGGHLLDRHTRTTVPRNPHDVLAELFRIRLGHSDILPTRPTGQARSDVTRSCGRPLLVDLASENMLQSILARAIAIEEDIRTAALSGSVNVERGGLCREIVERLTHAAETLRAASD
ncbi:hypothetical protein [Streptomyces sp. RKAG337]|uniref:hypothetical protein n=1 Tax=Streptomyces sp. RKAG337 TaxID=2893404 RepID=UPI0020342EC8|nr:hypothetical protein [Streptomyces sp. RKAG337]MCM2428713.1 hypothetical protein [Streptomyces sp. RKAG337]